MRCGVAWRTALHRTAPWCGTGCGAVQRGGVGWGAVGRGVAWRGVVWRGVAGCSAVRHAVCVHAVCVLLVRCSAVRCGVVRCVDRTRSLLAQEIGRVSHVKVQEIGGKKVTVFQQEHETSKLSTIIVRGPTANILDDVERAIDDGVNAYKALTRDNGLVPGAGACEIELYRRLIKVADECAEMHQYAMKKYAEAFMSIPTTLAEVSGHNATNVFTALMADHQNGQTSHGVDIEEGTSRDMVEAGVLDLYLSKFWAIKFATDAALTVLRVDTIIMAKQAGGPKAPQGGAPEED